jgi:hypothetical protein
MTHHQMTHLILDIITPLGILAAIGFLMAMVFWNL